MYKLADYVSTHAVRGDCTCGRCADSTSDPKQPNGHTADLVFFKVANIDGDADAMRELVEAEQPHWLDGKEHNYLETGADIGDQGLALTAMGLGSILGLWQLTPRMLPIGADLQMAGMGMISILACPA